MPYNVTIINTPVRGCQGAAENFLHNLLHAKMPNSGKVCKGWKKAGIKGLLFAEIGEKQQRCNSGDHQNGVHSEKGIAQKNAGGNA